MPWTSKKTTRMFLQLRDLGALVEERRIGLHPAASNPVAWSRSAKTPRAPGRRCRWPATVVVGLAPVSSQATTDAASSRHRPHPNPRGLIPPPPASGRAGARRPTTVPSLSTTGSAMTPWRSMVPTAAAASSSGRRRPGRAGHHAAHRQVEEGRIPLGQAGEVAGGEYTRQVAGVHHHREPAVVGQAHHRLPHRRVRAEHMAWMHHHVAARGAAPSGRASRRDEAPRIPPGGTPSPSSSATASASPSAKATVVLVVGARSCGQASSATAPSSVTSARPGERRVHGAGDRDDRHAYAAAATPTSPNSSSDSPLLLSTMATSRSRRRAQVAVQRVDRVQVGGRRCRWT